MYILSDDPGLEREGIGLVRIGLAGNPGDDRQSELPTGEDGQPLKLVFRAIFKETRDAAEWEQRLTSHLRQSGVEVGSEFFFINDKIVENICDAAAHAERFEWLVPPADPEFVDLAMELSRARRRVDETFDAWSRCGRTANAEIKINSYTQYVARNDKRVNDLQGSYVTPRFYNDGVTRNSQLDYSISRIKEETRKWRSEIKRLRQEIEESEVAFIEWKTAVKEADALEERFAELSAAHRPDGN